MRAAVRTYEGGRLRRVASVARCRVGTIVVHPTSVKCAVARPPVDGSKCRSTEYYFGNNPRTHFEKQIYWLLVHPMQSAIQGTTCTLWDTLLGTTPCTLGVLSLETYRVYCSRNFKDNVCTLGVQCGEPSVFELRHK